MSDNPSISFEDALGQLQQIVSSLESGQVNLEQSLTQFERGVALVSHCRVLLDKAHQRVEVVVSRPDAETVETAPFDPTATYSAEAATNSDAEIPSGGAKSRRRRADPDQRGLFS